MRPPAGGRVRHWVLMLAAALVLQGCAGRQAVRTPSVPPAPSANAGAAASTSTGTNIVSGDGAPVGAGAAPSSAPPRPSSTAARPSPAPAAPPPRPVPAPLVWPAPGTPLDAYLAALSPRQRDCMMLNFERQDLTVARIRDMDAFPAGNLIAQSRARCDAVLPRVDPARLRSDIRCTLDLPGAPVSRCDEVFVRTVDGRTERLDADDALRAELAAGNDASRRVVIARVERDDAAAERLGRGAGAAATPSAPSVPTPVGASSVPVPVPAPVPTSPIASPSTAAPPSVAAASSPAPAAPAPATAAAPAVAASTPAPSIGAAPVAAAAPSATTPPGPRYLVLVTCGPAGQHLRVQDCFAGSRPTTLELRRADGSRQVFGPAEILRAGPTGKDGLTLTLDAPFELRARNASDTLLLGVRVVDRRGGRTVSFEQVSGGGVASARQ